MDCCWDFVCFAFFSWLPTGDKIRCVDGGAVSYCIGGATGNLGNHRKLYESTQDASSPVGSSFEYRHALTDAIRSAVAKEPGRMILGYGMGTFREIGLDITFLGHVQHWYTCDNNWAKFLYETGYGGLLVISWLLLTPLVMTLRVYKRLTRSRDT